MNSSVPTSETGSGPAPDGLGPDAFRLLFVCLAIVGVGNSMLFAVLPPIARESGLPDWCVSAIFSGSAVLWVLTSPLWGRVSDERGRKPLIVLGLAAYATSTLAFTVVAAVALAGHWGWLWVFVSLALARAIFGAMGSATNPAVQAYIADVTPPETRTREIAAVTSAFAFGSAGGPALAAGMIAWLGLLAPLWAVSVTAALGALAAWRLLPPVRRPVQAKRSAAPRDIWALAARPQVRPWLLFGVLLSAVTAVMFQQLSFYFIDILGVSPREGASLVAVALAAGALAQIAAQLGLLPRLQLTPRGLILSGTLVTAAGSLLTAVGSDFGVLAAAQILIGLGFGLARPGFTGGASLSVSRDDQGSIAGLVVAANGAGFVVAPVFGAGLYALVAPQAPFWFCTVVLLALALYGQLHPGLRGQPLTEPPADHPGH